MSDSARMLRSHRRPMGWAMPVGVALAGLLLVGFVTLVVRAQRLPTDVVPVAWDRTVCGHCRMHVGEPRFAAQVQLADGQVLNFDDPGCMLQWTAANPAPLHAAYVHHHREDRWMRLEDAAFVRTMPTPMGFGLGAVDASSPQALTVAAARRAVKGGDTMPSAMHGASPSADHPDPHTQDNPHQHRGHPHPPPVGQQGPARGTP